MVIFYVWTMLLNAWNKQAATVLWLPVINVQALKIQIIIVAFLFKETCLYNPALFANLNPCMWDMAREYLEFVEKHPCPLAWIRGHFFKIYQKM